VGLVKAVILWKDDLEKPVKNALCIFFEQKMVKIEQFN
jgi:hypothetical protein